MTHPQAFKFCPHCGAPGIVAQPNRSLHCPACGFVLFLNIATAVGALIADEQGRLLLVRRNNDPAQGKLGIPGGFVDAGESAEQGLAREVREETGLLLAASQYFCSFPNHYHYKEVTYLTADLFFICHVTSFASLHAGDETQSTCFLAPEQIDPEEIAFPTLRRALEVYREHNSPKHGNSQMFQP